MLQISLKSLSQTGILYILVGTYDLFNVGKLNGQVGRRCLPVHFPRYQLEREVDCIAFQTALLELLRRVPLECAAERWVTDHWLYFYECSVGCIGISKDWLLRAVSAALDDGASRLSLDCVQDEEPMRTGHARRGGSSPKNLPLRGSPTPPARDS